MYSQVVFKLTTNKRVLLIVVDKRIMCDQCVLGADIDAVVDLPVHVSHFASRVEQTLLRRNRSLVLICQ